jgi:hypothetical protein
MAAYDSALKLNEYLKRKNGNICIVCVSLSLSLSLCVCVCVCVCVYTYTDIHTNKHTERERERERERDELDDDGSVCVSIQPKIMPHNQIENGKKYVDKLWQRMRRHERLKKT